MLKYVTLLLVIIVLSLSDGRHYDCDYDYGSDREERLEHKVCQKKGCKHTADYLRKYMNLKIDPCDDFYQFACGKFINNTKIPHDKDVIGPFYDAQDDVYTKLIKTVEKLPHHEKAKPFVLVKELYKMCMNKKQREKEDNKPLKDILKRLGGWPVQNSNVDWKVLTYKLRKLGYPTNSLISLTVERHPSNSTRAIIALSQPPKFGLSISEILDDDEIAAYYDKIVKAAKILGVKEQFARKALNGSVELELDLIYKSSPIERLRIARTSSKPMTVAELQTKYPSIDWLQYITKILNTRSIKITKDEEILVLAPLYFENIEEILKRPSMRTAVANYILWKAVYFSSSLVAESLYNIQSELQMMRKGTLSKPQRDKRCIEDVVKNIPLATASLYVRKLFNDANRHSAVEMVKKLKFAFGDTLNETKWLDKLTKRYALEKLNSMRSQIGYYDQLVDSKILNKYYSALKLDPDNYLNQTLKVLRFKQDKEFLRLRQHQKEVDWSFAESPVVFNAYHLPRENQICGAGSFSWYLLLKLPVNIYKGKSNEIWINRFVFHCKIRDAAGVTGMLQFKSTLITGLLVHSLYRLIHNRVFPVDISAAILQEFAFNKDTPQYMSYGTIGFAIGHEMMHGFDDQGHMYNKDGNSINWWTKKSCKAFNERVRCLINQYSNIAVPEVGNAHLNGENTIGENIADNGGVRMAYKAYTNWVKHESTTEPYLPNLNYSPNQMFWISYATMHCAKQTSEILEYWILNDEDPHLPDEYRVLVPLRNSEAFSKDFNCPLGSKMNPYKKCRLW